MSVDDTGSGHPDLDATDARAGRPGVPVLWVLVISTVVALIAVAAVWAVFSHGLSGGGGQRQVRSRRRAQAQKFNTPTVPASTQPSQTRSPDGDRLATPAGFEPATVRLEGGCSIRLSYGVGNASVVSMRPGLLAAEREVVGVGLHDLL